MDMHMHTPVGIPTRVPLNEGGVSGFLRCTLTAVPCRFSVPISKFGVLPLCKRDFRIDVCYLNLAT